MKILLLCFLAVQVKAVFCTHRRHGQSRNSASFLLRKVCVEVTGLKEEVSGLKEENLVLKKKVAELEENIAGSKQAVDGNWAGWMQWSGCSNNCGPGTRTRQRQCLDPRPSNGGSDCLGAASETEDCEVTGCGNDEDPYSAFSIYGVAPTKPGTSVIIWPSTKLNIATNNATHYDTSTGKYCAEYYGLYMFNLHLYKISEQGSSKCYIFKESQSGMMSGLAQASVGSSSLESSTTTIVELGQGECVYVGGCSGFSFLSSFTSFSGTLIHYLLD